MRKVKSITFILIVLALTLIVSVVPAFAMESSHSQWPDFSGIGSNNYLSLGYVHFENHSEGYEFRVGAYKVVELYVPSDLENMNLKVDYYTVAKNNGSGVFSDSGITFENYTQPPLRCRIEPVSQKSEDYSQIQYCL